MYKVVLLKSCNSDLRKLIGQGQKKVVQAVRAAMTEAGTNGEIVSIPRTKHGESRIPNVEKYDLTDGYRLVVQLVDGVKRTRAFLFVGNHDDAQHWLDVHRNYKWVQNRTDGVLEFVLVTNPSTDLHVPADRLNMDALEEDRQKPILHRLSDEDWKKLNLSSAVAAMVRGINAEQFEQDADGIFERLWETAGDDSASLLFDLMWHSHTNEWSQFRKRLALMHGKAEVLESAVAADEMLSPDNSEAFITFDDSGLWDELFSKGTLADWMLFLHPEQKSVAERELKGPARLRGVSGSGKTCVLVHRARALAKKYANPVLLVTLTESMRKLLERLRDDLCGVEGSLITVKTMSMLARDTLGDAGCRVPHAVSRLQSDPIDEAIKVAESSIRQHVEFSRSAFKSMGFSQLASFLRTEISYVRGRLVESNLDVYLDAKAFQRRGRGMPLSQSDRRIVLGAITAYMGRLEAADVQDHEGLVSKAIIAIRSDDYAAGRFRCVLSDEVQDLSELDISLMGGLKTPGGLPIAKVEDGLFLAGDGAQSIYKRGFALRRVGIDIVGRSFNLKKNYRNTNEILKAAFGLVSQYEFADVDEENVARPAMPDFAESHGARPLLVKCTGTDEEAEYIADSISSSLAMGQSAGQICVIAPSSGMRSEIEAALGRRGFNTAELRHDVDYESENVKVSTIESAKGHEFSAVYIMGLVEGSLPSTGIAPDELPREASRLYVAMTRAREKLVITYSPRAGFPASRFLTSIQPDCDEAQLRDGEFRKISV